MQEQADAVDVRIGVKVIDARSIKRARPANDPMDFVTFFQQQVRKITSVLAGNAGDKRFCHERRFALKQTLCTSNFFKS